MLLFFFFNDTATTEIYTLSLHDALPISRRHLRRPGSQRGDLRRHAPQRLAKRRRRPLPEGREHRRAARPSLQGADRKSTRLNSSHSQISYAVFCLKKKKHFLHHSHWSYY